MKVLVTGATGYLGSHVASALAAAGHTVLALARPGSEGRVPPGCRAVPGDVLETGSVRRALAGCDALVHLAALVRNWVRDPRQFDRINVEAVAATLRAAEEAGVGRIVYTSTIAALGPTDGRVRDESAERTDFRFHTNYERSKSIAERMVREKAAAGLPVVIVYPGVIYGPGTETAGNLVGRLVRAHVEGRLKTRLGRGDLRICYAYVGDVARGHLLALERGAAGRGYILGGENLTLDQFFAVLEELTGAAAPRWSVPYWIGEGAGRVLRAVAWATGVPPAITDGVVATFRHEWAYSSVRAARELGYATTPFREGLRLTLEALRREPSRPAGAA